MFRGSLPPAMQKIIAETATGWKGRVEDVYVLFSGNLTIERTIMDLGFRLHGNDVNFYSAMLGSFYAAQPFRIQVRPEYEDRFGWMADYLDDPAEALATVMLCTTMLQGVNNETNPFYERQRASYRSQWPVLVAKTTDKIRALDLRLSSFYVGDALQLLRDIPADAAVVAFPPFFAGDYESQFKALETVFDWDAPTYDIFGPDQMTEYVETVQARSFWMMGNNKRWPQLADFLRGRVQTTNRGMPIYLYASEAPARLVMPHQQLEPVPIRRLITGERLDPGTPPRFVVLTAGQFMSLRSQYMNKHIRPGSSFAVALALVGQVAGEDRLIGAVALSRGEAPESWPVPSPNVYMLSDFPVNSSDYRHLAKLVVMCATTEEARQLSMRYCNHPVRSLVTTAFSDRPASMKYRGQLQLLKRTEQDQAPDDDDHANQRYKLNYGFNYLADPRALADVYRLWLAKHAELRG